jgi:Tol biopolymer transport system component
VRPSLRRVVATCLAKDPEERWQDARDLLRELTWIRDRDDAEGTPATRMGGSRVGRAAVASAIAALTLAVIALGALQMRGTALPTPPTVRFNVPAPPIPRSTISRIRSGFRQTVTDRLHREPSGWPIAAVASIDRFADARALAGTESGQYPFWSPDGLSIAFFAGQRLKRISVAGQVVQTICAASPGSGGSWSRSGAIVFSSGFVTGSLYTVPSAGGNPAQLTSLDASRQETMHAWPHFLADGERFLYLVRSSRPENTGVYVGSLKKSPPTRLIAVDSNAIPAGDHLYFVRQGTLWAQRFDQAHLRLTAEPVRIAEHVWAFSGHGGSAFSASDRSVVFRQAAKQITELWWARSKRPASGQCGRSREHVHVTLSPDDRRVAIERLDTNGNGVIWLHEIERGATSRFSFDPSWNWSPIWSPDGSRIAFAAAPDGKAGIFQKPTSGATEQEPLFTGDLLGFPNDWSSNGEWLMWSRSAPGTDSDIWGLRLSADRKPVPILQTPFFEGEPRLSPNGRWLAYTSNESGRREVYVRSFPAGDTKRLVSTSGGRQPAWRRDGRELFYRTDAGAIMAVGVKTDAGLRSQLPAGALPCAYSQGFPGRYDYAPTRDGQRFLVNILPGEATSMATVVLNWDRKNGSP